MNAEKLSNFIVIKSFSDNEQSLLDCIMPFVEYSLAKLKKEYIYVSEIKDFIKSECLVDIPQTTLQTLLKRLKKDNKVTDYEHWTIIRCVDNYTLSSNRYEDSLHSFSRDVNQVIDNCRSFCEFDMSDDELAQLLYDFIKVYQHSIDFFNGTVDTSRKVLDDRHEKLILFIKHISQYNNAVYSTFRNMFYGYILGQFVASGQLFDKKKLGACTVYVDTDFLLRVLDMQAPYFTEASLELLTLLHGFGFSVVVLPEIIDEARAVLSANHIKFIKEGNNLKEIYGAQILQLDGILGAFFRREMTTSQIGEYIDNLETEIRKLSLEIASKNIPANVQTKQKELEKIIEYKLKNNHLEHIKDLSQRDYQESRIREKAALDAKLLSFIRMKRAKRVFRFQDVRYILLSCDNTICRVNKHSHKFDSSIPECISESSLTNMLFVSNPSMIGEMPIKLFLSLFQSSKYIDYNVLSRFHDGIVKHLEDYPEDQKYLTEVFSNQHLFAEIKGHYEFDDNDTTYETDLIKTVFATAKTAAQQNEEVIKELSEKNKQLQQEIETLKNPKTSIEPQRGGPFDLTNNDGTPIDKEDIKDTTIAKKNTKAENLLRTFSLTLFFIGIAFLTFLGLKLADIHTYACTLAWWSRCSLCLSPTIFMVALAVEFHSEEVIGKIIRRIIYEDKSVPIMEMVFIPVFKSFLWMLTSGIIPIISVLINLK